MNNAIKQNIDFISSLKVFDEKYYLSQFTAETKPIENLLEHYYTIGWKDGKNPNSWFDSNFYIDTYKDVYDAQANPLFHYLKRGVIEGRRTGVDWLNLGFYLTKYEDDIPDNMHPFTHYMTVGMKQGLMPTDYIDINSLINKMYLADGFDSLDEVKRFITQYAVKKTKGVDTKFYSYLYEDLVGLSDEELVQHYIEHGKQDGRFKDFEGLLESMGLDLNILPLIDLSEFYKLNPLLSELSLNQIYLKILQYNKIDLIKFSDDDRKVARFYSQLGEHYIVKHHRDKAKHILIYANYIFSSSRANELLGNIFIDAKSYKQAKPYYLSALELGGESLWLFINTISCLRHLKEFKQAKNFIVKGLSIFPQNSYLLKLLDQTIEQEWNECNSEYLVLAKLQQREKLMEKVGRSVNHQVDALNRALTSYNSDTSLQIQPSLNRKKIHILGDYHIKQCVRYRIDQKVEQLVYAGYEVTTASWTNIDINELNLTDILIVYRAPALPSIVKAITKAKLLGKIVIYEIDDLIFDSVYPPNYSEYAGAVNIEEYGNLTHGMALFNTAARLCDYAIASTTPLKAHLAKLVSTGKVFLHRNGLDSFNAPIIENRLQTSQIDIDMDEDSIALFYGSGTLAHNSDFIEIALPAIEKILIEYDEVCLIVVGHLSLPKAFVNRFKNQVIQVPKTETIEEYWQYLSIADINLAVLEINEINNSKSELKWFEAACFKTPSVMSATQNYVDIINNYSDGILASNPDEWFDALNTLVEDEIFRIEIGQRAFKRVLKEYSIQSLSKNIDGVINQIIEYHEAKDD